MSRNGIQKVADVFSIMQTNRGELLRNYKDDQDLLLGQLLNDMKDFAKERFSKITMMKGTRL